MLHVSFGNLRHPENLNVAYVNSIANAVNDKSLVWTDGKSGVQPLLI